MTVVFISVCSDCLHIPDSPRCSAIAAVQKTRQSVNGRVLFAEARVFGEGTLSVAPPLNHQ